jgi:hypothetical protein
MSTRASAITRRRSKPISRAGPPWG